MSPVTLGIDVTQVETRLLSERDVCRRAGDLARDERPSSPRALVVEQDAVARVHAVCLAVVDGDPVAVELGDAVRRTRVEGRRLALRRLYDFAVQLGGGGLVETDVLLETASTDRIEQAKRAQGIDVAGVFGHLERDFDVRLSTEVVYL